MTGLCVFCHRPLPRNEQIEHFRVGQRIAYDPARGRLWAVCPRCARWNLAPIDERWEALEELERLTRERARVLAHTENIQLAQSGALEIVRIGGADTREEAWWRYGRELLRRADRTRDDLLLAIIIGLPGLHLLRREMTFREGAWRGFRRCDRCGAPLVEGELSARAAGRLIVTPAASGEFSLVRSCRRCERRGQAGGAVWSGAEARTILRTTLAYTNFDGATARQVDDAAGAVAALGGAEAFVRDFTRAERRLAELRARRGPLPGLALEIALNQEIEARLLRQELLELEDAWRAAEEVAAIADGELTPLPPPTSAAP